MYAVAVGEIFAPMDLAESCMRSDWDIRCGCWVEVDGVPLQPARVIASASKAVIPVFIPLHPEASEETPSFDLAERVPVLRRSRDSSHGHDRQPPVIWLKA
jgi:hypothetical protein